MTAVVVDKGLSRAAGWARGAGADCIVVADDEAVADGMKNAVAELAVSFGMNYSPGTLEDMVEAVMDGRFDHYRFVLAFSSLTDAMRAAVMGLKFSTVTVLRSAGGAGPAADETPDPDERYARERLAGRGVEVLETA